jgi:hypothetical protein
MDAPAAAYSVSTNKGACHTKKAHISMLQMGQQQKLPCVFANLGGDHMSSGIATITWSKEGDQGTKNINTFKGAESAIH